MTPNLRYARQLILPEVGPEGQEKLANARVLVVGLGGLGSPLAMYLAAAGVGTLGLVDDDVVDPTNLHRQILHETEDVGRAKTESAAATLTSLNPEANLELHNTRLTNQNALDLIARYDLVADGTDNFATRYLVNDACVLTGKPNVHASVFRFEGQVSVFGAPQGPCYRCLYPDPPPPELIPNCAEGGVLGVLPGIIGTLQAAEVIKLILGKGEPLIGRLLMGDVLAADFHTIEIPKDPSCPVCGEHPSITALQDYDLLCAAPAPPATEEISAKELQHRRADVFLLDVRNPPEAAIATLHPDALIPLAELPARLEEIPSDREVVVYCRTGVRSARAVDLLRREGIAQAKNLKGGLHAWAREVDPRVPMY